MQTPAAKGISSEHITDAVLFQQKQTYCQKSISNHHWLYTRLTTKLHQYEANKNYLGTFYRNKVAEWLSVNLRL